MSKFDGITTEELRKELRRRENVERVAEIIGNDRIMTFEEERDYTGQREITFTLLPE